MAAGRLDVGLTWAVVVVCVAGLAWVGSGFITAVAGRVAAGCGALGAGGRLRVQALAASARISSTNRIFAG